MENLTKVPQISFFFSLFLLLFIVSVWTLTEAAPWTPSWTAPDWPLMASRQGSGGASAVLATNGTVGSRRGSSYVSSATLPHLENDFCVKSTVVGRHTGMWQVLWRGREGNLKFLIFFFPASEFYLVFKHILKNRYEFQNILSLKYIIFFATFYLFSIYFSDGILLPSFLKAKVHRDKFHGNNNNV